MKTYNNTGYWLRTLQVKVKSNITTKTHGNQVTTSVVGVTYEGRQAVVAQLQVGESVRLRREPDNPYDTNAICVERQSGEQIGYINRQLAANLASRFDAYGKTIPATVKSLAGNANKGQSLGVSISFTMPNTNLKGVEQYG
jgi:hypothetical protein